MNYTAWVDKLRLVKEKQTLEKMARLGYMDEDDYGSVPSPDGFEPRVEFNDPVHSTFYGARLWGKNFRHICETHPVYVDPHDAIAGRWMFILQRLRPFESAASAKNMDMAPVFNFDHLKPYHEKYGIMPGIGKMHHFAGDIQIGLDLGWGGLLEKVRKYAPVYPEKEEFYTAEEDVILGIQTWILHTVDGIREKLASQTDPDLRANLQEMLDVNKHIINDPPRTFREACQWIAWMNMAERTYCRAGAGCQLDEVLLPYYDRDKKAGILDDEKAKWILACLLINDPHYYQIAGPDGKGGDVTNAVSFLILEAAHMCGTSCNITIRVHDKLNEKLFRRGLEILMQDRKGTPRFSGDKALIEGFVRNGYSAELARKRIAVGCHWMSLPGLEYTLNDLIKINFAKVFEVAFKEIMHENNRSVEKLYGIYMKHLGIAVRVVAEGIDFHLANQYRNAPELTLNLISHGPIEKGLDASHGGMQYYNICVDGSGLATASDSFAALEQRIELDRLITWEQVDEALTSNFAGTEGERIRQMLNSIQRFGYGNSIGDKWAIRLSHDFSELVHSRRTPAGRLMIPGLFSWANTVMLGKMVGATPNGRYAYTPISHGANPDPGFRRDGAFTAMAKAIASVQCGYGNTAPFQLELNPTLADREDAVDLIGAVIKSHFEMGGTLININVMDKDTLLKANENPAAYPDLVVRVTGFTAYFATLSPEFRQLVVNRVINDV